MVWTFIHFLPGLSACLCQALDMCGRWGHLCRTRLWSMGSALSFPGCFFWLLVFVGACYLVRCCPHFTAGCDLIFPGVCLGLLACCLISMEVFTACTSALKFVASHAASIVSELVPAALQCSSKQEKAALVSFKLRLCMQCVTQDEGQVGALSFWIL